MSLTDRDRKIVLAIVPLLLIVAYWFLLLAPKREEATSAAADATRQQQRVDTARTAVGQATEAETGFASDYGEIVRLGKAIPAQVDMPSLIVQLDRAAEGTGIRFTKIATGERVEGGAAPAPAPAPAPATGGETPPPTAAGGEQAQSAPGGAAEAANDAAATSEQRSEAATGSGVSPSDTQTSTSSGSGLPVGGGAAPAAGTTSGAAPAGLETVPLDLEFQGDFFRLADFFHRVKRFVDVVGSDVVVNGRLVTIESVKYSSDPELFPRIRAELTATVYLSPEAQGTTAGATPQGPDPAVTPDAPTPAATESTTPAPAPTATVTP